jgi:hypothetical protein
MRGVYEGKKKKGNHLKNLIPSSKNLTVWLRIFVGLSDIEQLQELRIF